MVIQRLPVGQLRPAPYNPRKVLKPGMPGYRRLERSLREFDLVQPLVWNRATGHVVAGHQRLEILKAQGIAEVDVVVVDLPLAKEKALNVALNNQLVGGDWDAEKLIDVVRELQSSAEVDVALTGFDAEELSDLLLSPQVVPPDDDDEESSASECVHVEFDVPVDAWDALRADLDPVFAEHAIRVHVRKAGTSGK
jgi:ParB-like chromosome segregation protein Spo0J